MWPVARLRPYARNPRRNDHAVDRMCTSIQEYGFTVPMLVRGDGEIVDGHLRLKAALKLELADVPVIVCDGWTDAQVRAFRLLVNRSVNWADWDPTALAGEMLDLKGLDFDLSLTGFDVGEIGRMTTQASDGEDDVPPVPTKPVSRLGDLWLLGKHRVLCGDATDGELVSRAVIQPADLIFTDPPYGVDYEGGTTKRERLAGDATTELYGPCCRMSARFSRPGAALYLWHAGVKGIAAAAAAAAAGYEIRCEIVWNKNLAQFGSLSAQYKQKHEPCYYCFKQSSAPKWYGPTNEVTVWDCNRSSKNGFHPTQKPVELARRAFINSSKEGDVVLDLFLGSGSSLIAAETTNRACYGLEIHPPYVDVIVERWQNFTGAQATLDGDGRTFSEIALERKGVAA